MKYYPSLVLRGDLLIGTIAAGPSGHPAPDVVMRTVHIDDARAVADLADWCLDHRPEEHSMMPLGRDAMIKAAGCRSYKAFSQGASHVALKQKASLVHVNGFYNIGGRGYLYSADRQALLRRDADLSPRLVRLLRDPSLSTQQPRTSLLDAVVEAARPFIPKWRSDVHILIGLDQKGEIEWAGRWTHLREYEDVEPSPQLHDAIAALRNEEIRHGWTPWTTISADIHPRRRVDRMTASFGWERQAPHPRSPLRRSDLDPSTWDPRNA